MKRRKVSFAMWLGVRDDKLAFADRTARPASGVFVSGPKLLATLALNDNSHDVALVLVECLRN
jgi:hypothetical protein